MRWLIQIVVCEWMMTASGAAVQMPPMVTREEAETALRAALTTLGTRYVWGGQTPSGSDCSGLAIWACNQSVPSIQWCTGWSLKADTAAHMLFMYNVKPGAAAGGVARRPGVCHQQHRAYANRMPNTPGRENGALGAG
jgi:hypothetical protein